MSTARTLALFFTSILFLFSIFWFLTPSHFSSLHFNGLESVISCLQHKRNNEKVESFTNRKTQFYNQDLNRLEAGYSVKDDYGVGNFPPANRPHYSNENLAPDVKEVGLGISPTTDMYQGVIVEARDELIWPEIPEDENKSDDSSEAVIVTGKNVISSARHGQYSEKASDTISTSRIVKRKQSNKTESTIGRDVQFAGPTFIFSVLNETRPHAELEYKEMDSNHDLQSSELEPLEELELPELKESREDRSLDIDQETSEVLEVAVPKFSINEKASDEDFGRFKASIYDEAPLNSDDAASITTNEISDRNFEHTVEDEIMLNMPLNESMEDRSLDIDQETSEVLEVAVPKFSINEKASDEDFGRFKASIYDEAPPNSDDAASITTNEMSDQNFEHTVEDEIMLNMPLNEMDEIVLSKKNFSDFISDNKYVVVNFYTPRAYWNKAEYAAAANMLKDKVMFATVDANEEKELARKYMFLGYPNMYFFIGGVHMHTYRYCCRKDSVVSWVKEKMNGGVHRVIRLSDALDVSMSDSMVILGYLDSLEGPDSTELVAASKLESDVIFYQTASEFVAKMLHVNPKAKRPALFVLRKDAGKFIQFDGPFNRLAISNFVSINKFPLVTTFNAHNGLLILKNRMKQLWLFALDNNLEKVMFTFQEAAKAFNGKLLFVYIKMDHKDVAMRLSYEIGATWNEPKVIAYSGNEALMKYAMNGELSFSNIKSFGENFLDDKISGKPITSSNILFERLLEW